MGNQFRTSKKLSVMNKILKFKTDNTELSEKAFRIRTKVFVEEQNTDHDVEFDGFDDEADHFLFLADDIPAGTSRIRITEEGIKLERLAVLKEYRGKGVGAKLMEHMMKDVLPTDKKIYLNSQAVVEKVYEKFGFKRVGEMFYEANIEHYKMVYQA